jgi:hypothetical protein
MMPLWDKVKQELDRAGDLASSMLDEGKVRHEAFRARQLADKAAQALGYAVYRARQEARELDPDAYARLSSTLATHEAEVKRLEARLEEMVERRKARERGSAGPTEQPADESGSGPV